MRKNTFYGRFGYCSGLRRLPLLAGAVLCAASLLVSSCKDDNVTEMVDAVDPENFATMTSRDVSSLISDSGITRYRIETPLWLVYDEAKDARWTFPEGLHIEKFDDNFKRDATIDCDSATYFKERKLWRLDGYVDIKNELGEKFLTEQLFWDQNRKKVYSDSFIHIERADRVIEGYGFVSNERMTSFRVLKPSAILPVNQYMEGDEEQADSANVENADSVQPEPVKPVGRRSPQKRRSSVGIPLDTMSKFDVNPASVQRPGEVMRRKPRKDE